MLFVVKVSEKEVSLAEIILKENEAYKFIEISALATLGKDNKRKNFATSLMEAIIKGIRELERKLEVSIFVYLNAINGTVSFYEKFGFVGNPYPKQLEMATIVNEGTLMWYREPFEALQEDGSLCLKKQYCEDSVIFPVYCWDPAAELLGACKNQEETDTFWEHMVNKDRKTDDDV